MTITILENCTGCGRCVAACPQKAISLTTERPDGYGCKWAIVDRSLCIDCHSCLAACPHRAITRA